MRTKLVLAPLVALLLAVRADTAADLEDIRKLPDNYAWAGGPYCKALPTCTNMTRNPAQDQAVEYTVPDTFLQEDADALVAEVAAVYGKQDCLNTMIKLCDIINAAASRGSNPLENDQIDWIVFVDSKCKVPLPRDPASFEYQRFTIQAGGHGLQATIKDEGKLQRNYVMTSGPGPAKCAALSD